MLTYAHPACAAVLAALWSQRQLPPCPALSCPAVPACPPADGAVCKVLQRCGELRVLALRGLLYNADATAAAVAASCRHLTSLDLRHCSTLSGGSTRHADTTVGQMMRIPLALCNATPAICFWNQISTPCLCPCPLRCLSCRCRAGAGGSPPLLALPAPLLLRAPHRCRPATAGKGGSCWRRRQGRRQQPWRRQQGRWRQERQRPGAAVATAGP